MNALANSQYGELEKFLRNGFPDGKEPVTFARYTGQESEAERKRIVANPPDILLTNYVMLELILTRPQERRSLIRRPGPATSWCSTSCTRTGAGRERCRIAGPAGPRRLRGRRTSVRRHVGDARRPGTRMNSGPGRRGAFRIFGTRYAGTTSSARRSAARRPRATSMTPRPRSPTRRIARRDYGRLCVADPLSCWIESDVRAPTGRKAAGWSARAPSITGPDGAASDWPASAGVPVERCAG